MRSPTMTAVMPKRADAATNAHAAAWRGD